MREMHSQSCFWAGVCLFYQVDESNQVVRRIALPSRAVSALAGTVGVQGSSNGIGSNAKFRTPVGVAIDAEATFALVVSLCCEML